jgi:hypothetical protein
MMAQLRTTIEISFGGFQEYEVPVEVEYTFRAGCSQTYEQPGEADTVTLDKIKVIEAGGNRIVADWLVELLEADDELLALCAQDWLERADYAAEQAADARREESWLNRTGASS